MKRSILGVLAGVLLALGVVQAQNPLTPALSLSVNTDQNGYLVTALGAYTAPLGPLTSFSTIRLRTDSAGSLLITFPTGADGTVPTGVATGKVLASNGVGVPGVWSASPTLTSVLVGDGSAGAPSLAQANHPSSGLYFSAGGDVLISRLGAAVAGSNGAGLFYANILDVGGGADVLLNRDLANTLALRNSTNAQTFRVYSTYTDASNYRRAIVSADAGGAYFLHENAGTGTTLGATFGARGDSVVNFLVNNGNRWVIGNSATGYGLTGANPTGGLGYSTGAGGAVTQGTGRTTGVTINTVTGDITLFSAAGSATPATFTVTNSAVAVTDNIILSQKSGTDLYELFITNVAAGSFKVTFFTTGGTTVEQPVFHFSVIKGVSS